MAHHHNHGTLAFTGSGSSQISPAVTHTQSKKWLSAEAQLKKDMKLLVRNRAKFCPNSTILTIDFDLRGHQAAFANDLAEERIRSRDDSDDDQPSQHFPDDPEPEPAPPQVKDSFVDRKPQIFRSILSPVLCLPTAFVTYISKPGRTEGPINWPQKEEMKYEGDERICTDALHGRFLGAPRVSGNETVTWQQRAIVQPFPFDNFHYPVPSEVDIFLRTHYVEDIEPNDEQGVEAIGEELMRMLGGMTSKGSGFV